MEPTRRESQTSVHRVSCQFQSFLSNIKLSKLDGVLLTLNLIFNESTFLDQGSKDVGKDSVFHVWVVFVRQVSHLFLVGLFFISFDIHFHLRDITLVKVFGRSSVNSSEAEVVLLNNTGVKRVEIEE